MISSCHIRHFLILPSNLNHCLMRNIITHVTHFTPKLATLLEILRTSTLRLNYCEEDFFLGRHAISSAAHPMVSFSALTLGQIDNGPLTYGSYGVGFSTSWALKNSLHRVLYLDPNSLVAESLAELLRARQNQESSQLPNRLRLPIIVLKCFTKNTVGVNSHLQINNFDFSAEHEWRFVPTKAQIGKGLISQNMSTYRRSKRVHNDKLLPYPLKFKRADISIVTVRTESEIDLLIKEFGFPRKVIHRVRTQ
jgi:hypothetical protein